MEEEEGDVGELKYEIHHGGGRGGRGVGFTAQHVCLEKTHINGGKTQ